ncbi:MAG: hypothetical protein NTY02_03995 [Acidobacteria bacterium]|nr:hypothetical protein [Acidobacteriota bacterium]
MTSRHDKVSISGARDQALGTRPDLAVRQAAGVIDRSHRGRIVVRGADRRTFLHALLTNDIAALESGGGCYATLLTPQGRMVADMLVFELGDVLLLDVDRSRTDVLLTKFDQLIFSEDVQLGDVSDAWGAIGVYGPAAAAITGGVLGELPGTARLSSFAQYQNERIEFRGDLVVAARADGLGVPGFVLFASRPTVPVLGEAILEAGAVLIDPATAELLRIEAGEPAFPVDMTEDTIPYEAGIETRAVSFTKGCFPGQEVLVRIRDRGHGRIAKKLVGLLIEGDEVPSRGDRVLAEDKELGHVTSAVWSPFVGKAIALGYVHRDASGPGSLVAIIHGEHRLTGAVTALPFVEAASVLS